MKLPAIHQALPGKNLRHEMTDAQAQQAVASGSIMNVIAPEFCSQSSMLRRIPELDRPTAHEDVEVPELDLEFDFDEGFQDGRDDPSLGDEEAELREIDEDAKRLEASWASRTYEEGPPVLGPEALERLDAAMERVEVNRLLKMGVLKELGAESSVEGLMKLKSRFVFDWRYRAIVKFGSDERDWWRRSSVT